MEAQDQEMNIKKKRTKRPRTASPLSLTMASSSCSAGEGDDHISRAVASPSSSGGLARSAQEEEEEEDMANCLILLAQGRHQQKSSEDQTVNLATHKAATDVYQCKTCNRCFPSFQALGGHRASHKKSKPMQEDQNEGTLQRMIGLTGISPTPKNQPPLSMEQQPVPSVEETTTLSLRITTRPLCSNSNNKLRVHECSICGAEFNSGQALGGHMRRHRPIPIVTSHQEECSQEAKKPRAILSLDLNLPAPEDDHHHQESKFPFAAKEQVIVFSASPLVDCHY